MSSFKQIEIEEAQGKTKDLYDTITAGFGGVPNLFKMLGQTPDILEAVLAINSGITSGELTAKDVEQIALTVSSINACDYCVATHVEIGSQFKIPKVELLDNIQGMSNDSKMRAILNFAKEATLHRGKVSQESIKTLHSFNIGNKTIIEILTVVGLYTFLNYLNHLTQPVIDFPRVEYAPLQV
ncbi:carboxymuconolactone decarboxylase family protein [Aquimarina aquimarini]|uniref:carboxymuconolactone decarboxylase family protein n=1 Tax=Aquimarina aquimarini TaxID=1191734 RepID=UPI000D550D58|nr:carboxymuconolactone decarboxylase family protein [Aquimarina aquimarini]